MISRLIACSAWVFGSSPKGKPYRVSDDGAVMGTYVHGLFADNQQRAAWLQRFAGGPNRINYDGLVEKTLDALAAHLAAHLDLEALLELAR